MVAQGGTGAGGPGSRSWNWWHPAIIMNRPFPRLQGVKYCGTRPFFFCRKSDTFSATFCRIISSLFLLHATAKESDTIVKRIFTKTQEIDFECIISKLLSPKRKAYCKFKACNWFAPKTFSWFKIPPAKYLLKIFKFMCCHFWRAAYICTTN